jgi:hypothetical protein
MRIRLPDSQTLPIDFVPHSANTCIMRNYYSNSILLSLPLIIKDQCTLQTPFTALQVLFFPLLRRKPQRRVNGLYHVFQFLVNS